MIMEHKSEKSEVTERIFTALGTVNHIKVYDYLQEEAMDSAVNRVLEIERHMSAFLSESDITRINQNAGLSTTKVHEDTMQVLQCGQKYAKWSDGAFDMTIRPLVSLWSIGKNQNMIPSEKEIKNALTFINYKDIFLDEKKCEVKLKHKHQSLDLGGIAKGYAADEVKRILKQEGVKRAMINLGGNIVTLSNPVSILEWQIGIQNPVKPTGNYVGILSINEKAIVTSGVNERFFIKDKVRYHHLLNPKTGWPVKSSLFSVSIIGDCSMDADAVSTCLFVQGMEKGMELLTKTGMEAIFLTEDGGIYVTKKIQNSFTICATNNPAHEMSIE